MPEWLFLVQLVVAVVLGFLVGAVVASRTGWLRRLTTPPREMVTEVETRARRTFHDQRVHHTAGGTGLLVYVSLYERLAVVYGDQAVVEAIGQAALDRLCVSLTDGLKSGAVIDAICDTIEQAGEVLGKALPREDGDEQELPDALVLLDG